MKKGQTIFFWLIIALVLVGGMIYAFLPEIKKATGIGGGGNSDGTGGGTSGTGSTGGGATGGGTATQQWDLNKTLRLNVYDSREVKELQRMLNAIQKTNPISVDGDFGPMTQSKLIAVMGVNNTTLGIMKIKYPFV